MKKLLLALTPLAVATAWAMTASAAPAGPAAWIGSPIAGSVSSTPKTHGAPYGGQWSVDIKGSGTAKLYLAKDPAGDPLISARIVEVGYACGSYPAWDQGSATRRLKRGGKKVVIEVKYQSTPIGKITFSHLETSLAIGSHSRTIGRWGGTLGTVGTTYTDVRKSDGTSCWTGPHVHVEASNLNGGSSCYWSGLDTQWRTRGEHDYLGYVGYKSPTRVCPSGI